MTFQPTPDCNLLSTQDIRYVVYHHELFTTPDNPQNDESHIHSYYEIYINISGDVSFLVNDRLYRLKKGDVILTRPGDVHLCIYQTACMHEHFCLWLDVPQNSPLISFMHKECFQHHISLKQPDMERSIELLSLLSNKKTNSDSVTNTASLLNFLLLLQQDHHSANMSYSSRIPTEMNDILSYLNTHFHEIQYIQEIYDKFYVSPATLTRWFRKYIRISPREFLESKKLAYARQLLDEGASVTDAALQSGFSDCSYFIFVFKKRFGMTPLSYKRKASHGMGNCH